MSNTDEINRLKKEEQGKMATYHQPSKRQRVGIHFHIHQREKQYVYPTINESYDQNYNLSIHVMIVVIFISGFIAVGLMLAITLLR